MICLTEGQFGVTFSVTFFVVYMSVYEELIRGVPNANIQESAVLCIVCCTRMGLRNQWYVAMSAYHARSESAHLRLVESDDVVCFSLFSCSGLVSLHV